MVPAVARGWLDERARVHAEQVAPDVVNAIGSIVPRRVIYGACHD